MRSKLTWTLLVLVPLALIGGCGGPCGNILTLGLKVGFEGNIGGLTACEWQTIYRDVQQLAPIFNIDLSGVTFPELTTEQAQSIVDFLDANGINTIDELTAALDNGTITEEDIPDVLLDFYYEFAGIENE